MNTIRNNKFKKGLAQGISFYMIVLVSIVGVIGIIATITSLQGANTFATNVSNMDGKTNHTLSKLSFDGKEVNDVGTVPYGTNGENVIANSELSLTGTTLDTDQLAVIGESSTSKYDADITTGSESLSDYFNGDGGKKFIISNEAVFGEKNTSRKGMKYFGTQDDVGGNTYHVYEVRLSN